MKKVNLLLHTPDITNATSFYRAWGPLNELAKEARSRGIDISMADEAKYCWPAMGRYDVGFLHRPYQNHHVTMVRLLRDQNIPIWVDFDDYLFGLPPDNPCYEMYMDETIQQNIAKIITMADVVTVTTKHMKRKLQIPLRSGRLLNHNVHVIPNGPLAWTRKHQREHDVKKTTYLWRGSSTHQQDLFEVASQLLDFNETHKPDLTFLGYNPWFLTSRMGPNCKIAGTVGIDDYLGTIASMNPSAVIVPLHESDFNKSKSSIAYVEGTIAGALTIAPDFEEWRRPGVITYEPGSESGFRDALEAFHVMPVEKRVEYHKMAYDHVWNEMNVTKANELRHGILTSLVHGTPFPKGGDPIKEEETVMEVG